MRTLRTLVWSTGGVGRIAIDAIARRPDLELVGVWVHSPDKVGVGAGLRVVCRARSRTRRGRRPRLPAPVGGGHQRGGDDVDEFGASAVVLRAGLARPARRGGQG